ncbi:MAG: SEC-C domain-containing protein [Nitrososphaerota archaeon]|jgi:hypothetical protein|nr:SEC-C domain-containing protein [Nitrososphaerota archaeon]
MSVRRDSGEKYYQILKDVGLWAQQCQRHSDYKLLSAYERENFYAIVDFFATMMYFWHAQSPDKWTPTVMHTVLTETYPQQTTRSPSYFKAVEPILTLFLKHLENLGIINPNTAHALNTQLKIAAPEMCRLSENLHNASQHNSLLAATDDELGIHNASGSSASTSSTTKKIGRNDPCPCGSGKKYKKCCLNDNIDSDTSEKTNQSSKSSPDKMLPALTQWAVLHEHIKNIRQLKPWNFIQEADLITINLPGQKEPTYCTLLICDNSCDIKCHGIVICPGYASLNSFFRKIDADNTTTVNVLALEQDCLICHFGDREHLTSIDYAPLKELNLHFRGRNEWTYFRSLKPGCHVAYISSAQADLLILALKHFAMACTHLANGKIKVNFRNGEMLQRYYAPEKKLWMNRVIKPQPMPIVSYNLIVNDDPLIMKLNKKEYNNAHLEFDISYLPMFLHETPNDISFYSRFALLLDKTTHVLLGQCVVTDVDDLSGVVPRMLIGYIENFGRPLSISVRDRWLSGYIADFCQKIGVKPIDNQGVPAIDNLITQLLKLTTADKRAYQ